MSFKNTDFYNFIIVGAGPAGLTAGIVAKRLGLKVLILEKGEICAPKPRGEGMGHFPLVDDILGKDFLLSIGLKSSGGRIWHSPQDLQIAKTRRSYNHYFFEWREFINRFVQIANELKVEIRLNSEVIESIENKDYCVGVKYKNKTGKIHEVYGNCILDCSGHVGVIGRWYDIHYDEQMNCPIIKCRISKANFDIIKTPDLQFYFIGNGDLDSSPNFPPCVAYFFPLLERKAEIGLMLRMSQTRKMNSVKIPNNEEIMKEWAEIKKNYPGFSIFLQHAQIDYEELTYIPNAKFANNYIPKSGVILIGDSAGFIDPFGSSGLYYSMFMADFWANSLGNTLKYLLKKDEKLNLSTIVWEPDNIAEFKKNFENTEVFKHIMNSYNLIGAFEYKIFNRLRTADKINKKWDYIATLLEQASKS